MISHDLAKCDKCAETIRFKGRMTFHGIIKRIKELKWRVTKKSDGTWSHYCDKCSVNFYTVKSSTGSATTPSAVGYWWDK